MYCISLKEKVLIEDVLKIAHTMLNLGLVKIREDENFGKDFTEEEKFFYSKSFEERLVEIELLQDIISNNSMFNSAELSRMREIVRAWL